MIPARSALTCNEQCTHSRQTATFQKALLPGSHTFLYLHDHLQFFSVLFKQCCKINGKETTLPLIHFPVFLPPSLFEQAHYFCCNMPAQRIK